MLRPELCYEAWVVFPIEDGVFQPAISYVLGSAFLTDPSPLLLRTEVLKAFRAGELHVCSFSHTKASPPRIVTNECACERTMGAVLSAKARDNRRCKPTNAKRGSHMAHSQLKYQSV